MHTEQEEELISVLHLTGRAAKELSASYYCMEITLMRNEDIRKHLGTTTAGNHLCTLFKLFLLTGCRGLARGIQCEIPDRMGSVEDDKSQVS